MAHIIEAAADGITVRQHVIAHMEDDAPGMAVVIDAMLLVRSLPSLSLASQ